MQQTSRANYASQLARNPGKPFPPILLFIHIHPNLLQHSLKTYIVVLKEDFSQRVSKRTRAKERFNNDYPSISGIHQQTSTHATKLQADIYQS